MIVILASENDFKFKIAGEPKDIAAEYCAATKAIGEEVVKKIRNERDAVKFATYMTISKALSGTAEDFALEMLKLMSNRTPAEITVDVSDLDELKKQMQEMENGSDN